MSCFIIYLLLKLSLLKNQLTLFEKKLMLLLLLLLLLLVLDRSLALVDFLGHGSSEGLVPEIVQTMFYLPRLAAVPFPY